MQALIDFLIRNLLHLWPVARLYTYQRGVRVRCGHMRETVGPGLHWRWWFIDQFWITNISEKTIDLPCGSVTTADGRPCTISGNLSYVIENPALLWKNVNDFDGSLGNLALGRLCTFASTQSWEELGRRSSLEEEVLSVLREELKNWGVKPTRFHLTDLVEARHWRLFGDSPIKYARA